MINKMNNDPAIHGILVQLPLPKHIDDDPDLLAFLTKLFTQNKAVFQGETVEEERGAMAGMPVSAFIANIYLAEMDNEFIKMKVPYFRYSDDILLFADSLEELQKYQNIINRHIESRGLTINPESNNKPGRIFRLFGFQM